MSLQTTIKNNIATLTLDRPDIHNAFDDQLIRQLTDTLNTLELEPTVRVLILRATGKSFCAGADLGWMQRMVEYDYSQNLDDAKQLAKLMLRLYHFKKPTIAAVHGAAFGGGVGLVSCCDMAVAIDSVEFCLSETSLGLIPAVISPYIISAMGERAARRYFLTAERFSAAEAYRLGLIHHICTAHEFEPSINSLVNSILQNSPAALTAAKHLIVATSRGEINAPMLEDTAHRIATIRTSNEGQEGLRAFLEKRKPNWSV